MHKCKWWTWYSWCSYLSTATAYYDDVAYGEEGTFTVYWSWKSEEMKVQKYPDVANQDAFKQILYFFFLCERKQNHFKQFLYIFKHEMLSTFLHWIENFKAIQNHQIFYRKSTSVSKFQGSTVPCRARWLTDGLMRSLAPGSCCWGEISSILRRGRLLMVLNGIN